MLVVHKFSSTRQKENSFHDNTNGCQARTVSNMIIRLPVSKLPFTASFLLASTYRISHLEIHKCWQVLLSTSKSNQLDMLQVTSIITQWGHLGAPKTENLAIRKKKSYQLRKYNHLLQRASTVNLQFTLFYCYNATKNSTVHFILLLVLLKLQPQPHKQEEKI